MGVLAVVDAGDHALDVCFGLVRHLQMVKGLESWGRKRLVGLSLCLQLLHKVHLHHDVHVILLHFLVLSLLSNQVLAR